MPKRGITILLFVGALLLTALFYGALSGFFRQGQTYQFFSNRGLYQPVGVALTFLGLLLIGERWWLFREEADALTLPVPNTSLSREEAIALALQLPARYRVTIAGRRLTDLLNGYARGEDVRALQDRLSASDWERLNRETSLLGWLRGLPALIGFLGTLNGLRGGIAEFSRIGNTVDVEELRHRLQLFAGYAGTAFDTALLGIGATAVLSAAIFLLRRSEETHLAQVDDLARQIALQFPAGWQEDAARQTANAFLTSFLPVVERTMTMWLNHWQDELTRAATRILNEVKTP